MLKCSEIYDVCWIVKGMGSPFFYSCCQTAWPGSSANVSLNTLREHDLRLSLDPKSVSLLCGKSGQFCLFSPTHATSELCSPLLWLECSSLDNNMHPTLPATMSHSELCQMTPTSCMAGIVLMWQKQRKRNFAIVLSQCFSIIFFYCLRKSNSCCTYLDFQTGQEIIQLY